VAKRAHYHHGDLRAALVDAALALIAERGVEALSVAEAARRTGVSPAAPYRHFPTRLALLKATAIRAAELLTADLREAVAGAPVDDPVEAMAVTAAVYVRFVVRHHAGFDLIFAEQLHDLDDAQLQQAGRDLVDILLAIAVGITHDAATALDLMERYLAAAHGFATLHLSGFLRLRRSGLDDIVASATEATRILATAAQQPAVG
jgi:AcrR family transcriptional regulator